MAPWALGPLALRGAPSAQHKKSSFRVRKKSEFMVRVRGLVMGPLGPGTLGP